MPSLWFRRASDWLAPFRRRASRRAARKPVFAKLRLQGLEERTVPSGTDPFQVDVQNGNWQFFTAAAVDAQGDSVILYNSANGGGQDVWARRYDAAANPLTDPFLVNTNTLGDQSPGGVAMAPDGRFAIVWHGLGPNGNGSDVWARRYNAAGSPLDAVEFRVNQFTTGSQQAGRIAMDPDGNFAVAWVDQGRDANQLPQSYARLFSWDGLTTSSEFALEQQPSVLGNIYSQDPHLSLSATGTLVASFSLYTTAADPSGWAGYLQPFHYADTGSGTFTVTAQGNAFMPYTATTGDQGVVPVVAADGSFVAVVGNAASGPGSADIFLRHYAADGTLLDANAIPVATTVGDQWITGAGLDDGGNLVVTWREGGSGNDWSLYARSMASDGAPNTDPMRITPTTAAYHPWSGGAAAVAPDGSLTAVWTTYRAAAGVFGVEARHYEPIVDSVTETSTLRAIDQGMNEDVQVTATATTFFDRVLWEYRVRNVNYLGRQTEHNTTYVGLFYISFAMEGTTDVGNSMGWPNVSVHGGKPCFSSVRRYV